jgi:hypothetical protein
MVAAVPVEPSNFQNDREVVPSALAPSFLFPFLCATSLILRSSGCWSTRFFVR